ncbi:MAG: CvpA family protein [Chitinophagaceae bacterium]|nr:CvpA family protein [Chitinophagaceae bacterium]
MLLDGILLILCLIAFIRGWKKGLLWALVSVVAVLAGIILSLKFSHLLSDYLFEKNILRNQYTLLLSFILLFIGTIFLFRTLIRFVEGVLETFFLGWVNNLLGGLFYSFFVLFICSMFFWLSNKANLLNRQNKLDSKSYSLVEPLAPKTIAFVTPYLPFFKTLYNDVEMYLAKIAGAEHAEEGPIRKK